MPDYSPPIKRQLDAYAQTAYERELHAELARLDTEFGHWRMGRLSGRELSERIHRHHHQARKLYRRYASGPVDLRVADAIVNGALSQDEIDADALKALRPLLEVYQNDRAAVYACAR